MVASFLWRPHILQGCFLTVNTWCSESSDPFTWSRSFLRATKKGNLSMVFGSREHLALPDGITKAMVDVPSMKFGWWPRGKLFWPLKMLYISRKCHFSDWIAVFFRALASVVPLPLKTAIFGRYRRIFSSNKTAPSCTSRLKSCSKLYSSYLLLQNRESR